MTDSIIIVCMFGFIVGWSLNTMYRQYKDEDVQTNNDKDWRRRRSPREQDTKISLSYVLH